MLVFVNKPISYHIYNTDPKDSQSMDFFYSWGPLYVDLKPQQTSLYQQIKLSLIHKQQGLEAWVWSRIVNTIPRYTVTCRSTSLPSANGLFRSPAQASWTVFHHTWCRHHCSQYSDSVLKTFLFHPLRSGLVNWSLIAWFNWDLAIIFEIQATLKCRWWWWYTISSKICSLFWDQTCFHLPGKKSWLCKCKNLQQLEEMQVPHM